MSASLDPGGMVLAPEPCIYLEDPLVATATLDTILDKAYADEGLTREDITAHQGYISTGNLALDFVLGGGIARGRIAELFGLSQSGKTTTAVQVCAQAMALGEHVLYVDFEQALDVEYMASLGVDVESPLFHPIPAANLEDGMRHASEAIRTGEVALAVFDSVAAMTPKKIVEENTESRTTAMERARLLGNELGKLNPICARTGCAAIFINHERDVIETGTVRPGMPKRTTTPGGSGLKYYSSQRVQFKIVKTFKGERTDPLTGEKINEAHSVMSQATVTKNKLTRPMQVAQLYLVLGEGFSDAHAAMMVLEANKVVRKGNAGVFTFPEELYNPSMKSTDKGYTIQGLGNVLALASGMPDWGAQLSDRARQALGMHTDLKTALVDDPEGSGSPDLPQHGEELPPEDDEVEATDADIKLPSSPPTFTGAAERPSVSQEPAPAPEPASEPVAQARPPIGFAGVMDLTKI